MAEPSTNNPTSTVRSLNDLPDHILLHILSFLPTNPSTARTSLISRKWRNLWLSTPSLHFDSFGSDFDILSADSFGPDLDNLSRFIDRTLILRHPDSRLLNFCIISIFDNDQFTSPVNSWIRYAISRGVQKLEINLFDESDFDSVSDVRFKFHFSLLGNSQVRFFTLCHCDLSVAPPTNNMSSEKARFFSLRSIELHRVRISDQMMVDLMVACVNLEALTLSQALGCKDIKIFSSKLRELTLRIFRYDGYEGDEGSLEIVAPNLHSLIIARFIVGNYALRDTSSLVEAHVSFSDHQHWIKIVRLLGHVKHLYTDDYCFKHLESKDVHSVSFRLQNLKYVELQTHYNKSDLIGIALLLVVSPNLQMMVLVNRSYSKEKTSEESISDDFFTQFNLNLQSLKYVKMKSFKGMKGETSLLCALSKTGVSLESIVLIPAK